MPPNLFDYATTELSQDAVICWLLAWADPEWKSVDPTLHAVGCSLVSKLVGLHGVICPPPAEVIVHRQLLRADIVAEVGTKLVLLIEDKIRAGLHGDQLDRYLQQLKEKFIDALVLPVFLKTGDQSSYVQVEKAGYKLFLRTQILDLLRPWRDKVSNSIFSDFLTNLESREAEIESYATKPVSDWTQKWDPWIGFYKRLQREISGKVEWDYVSNAAGGFLGAWWHFTPWRDPSTGIEHDVYLQIERGPLCFKIAVDDEGTDRSALWDRWYTKLTTTAERFAFEVKRTRRRPGTWMTVARVELGDWMSKKSDGSLDLERTLDTLRHAAEVLDHASAVGD